MRTKQGVIRTKYRRCIRKILSIVPQLGSWNRYQETLLGIYKAPAEPVSRRFCGNAPLEELGHPAASGCADGGRGGQRVQSGFVELSEAFSV